jgi:hypothetical protein
MNPQEVGYSPGKSLRRLYKQVFDEIYPQIKDQKIGILSTVIGILEPEESQEIYQIYKINMKASLKDDLSISSDIFGLFLNNPNENNQWVNNLIEPVNEGIKNLRKSLPYNLEDPNAQLFTIVVIGCFLVGGIACKRYLNKKQEKPELRKGDKTHSPNQNNSPPKPKIPQPVALCLVVPASVVGNFKKNNPINVSDIEKLIDNASYFLSTIPQDANATRQLLKLTDEDISNASENREVYVRIDIDDGEEMIGKKVPFILKKNLPKNGELIVTELACLKYLSNSGLEKFNRV